MESPATTWFTVRLEDRPGALARLAGALGDRGVSISGIVGIAEEADGALMLTTTDVAATREALAALGLPHEVHAPGDPADPAGAAALGELLLRGPG